MSLRHPVELQENDTVTTKIMTWALVILSFLPYAGIALGSNTNMPLVSIVSIFAIPYFLKMKASLGIFIGFLAFPLVSLFFVMVMGGIVSTSNIIAGVVWIAHVMPFIAWATCVIRSPATVVVALKVILFCASAYAIIQKMAFLDRGQLPFAGMYILPGYWSVNDNIETITTYIRRPFGWFPEPSFMAGSLAIGLVLLFIMKARIESVMSPTDFLVFGAAVSCLIMSGSGSSALTLVLLASILLWPRNLTKIGRYALFPVVVTAFFFANSIISSRSATTINFSWNDRFASIMGGVDYLWNNPQSMFSGIGQGNASVYAASAKFDYSKFGAFNSTDDVVSVLGRMLVENGIFGIAVVVGLTLVVYLGSSRVLGRFAGACSAAVWVVVSGLTISYESATLIWALPGVCLGLLLAAGARSDRTTDVSIPL